jgi:hypothetical protein
METPVFTPIERWAARSKSRAFTYLVGLALFISACLAGGAALLATIATPGSIASASGPTSR